MLMLHTSVKINSNEFQIKTAMNIVKLKK